MKEGYESKTKKHLKTINIIRAVNNNNKSNNKFGVESLDLGI